MNAVSTIDTVGGLILAVVAGLYLICSGITEHHRARPPSAKGRSGTASPPVSARSRTGIIVAADPVCREGAAGSPPCVRSAVTAIETLTFPGPYSQIGTKR